MATDKKSFMFYCDWIDTFKALPKDKGYDLLIHLLEYAHEDYKDPISDDIIVNSVFPIMKNQLKRDLKKWEKRAETSRINGQLGGRPPKEEEPKKPNGLNENPVEPKKPVTVKGIGKEIVIVKGILNKKENTVFNFRKELLDAKFNKELVEDWLKVRKLKKLANTQTALISFVRECSKTKYQDYDDVLRLCVENSWGGFKSTWLDQPNNKSLEKHPKSQMLADKMKEDYEL
jgi:hypothetical protein